MCFRNKMPESNKQKSPRTPRTPRLRQRELLKPKLSRKVVPSARVNLNSYWSTFEEISKKKAPVVTFDVPSAVEILSSSSVYSTFYDAEINENLINELIELGKL